MSTSCASYREALSAHVDGERHELSFAVVDAHVVRCDGCTAFAAGLTLIDERVAAFRALPVPDGTADVLAAAGTERLRAGAGRTSGELRGVLVVAAVVQLVLAVTSLTGFGDHVARDLAIYQLAATAGLAAVAWRPHLAAGVLPVVGLAALLGLVTTTVDVVGGVSSVGAELPHIALAVAVWPLAALARRSGAAGTVSA